MGSAEPLVMLKIRVGDMVKWLEPVQTGVQTARVAVRSGFLRPTLTMNVMAMMEYTSVWGARV